MPGFLVNLHRAASGPVGAAWKRPFPVAAGEGAAPDHVGGDGGTALRSRSDERFGVGKCVALLSALWAYVRLESALAPPCNVYVLGAPVTPGVSRAAGSCGVASRVGCSVGSARPVLPAARMPGQAHAPSAQVAWGFARGDQGMAPTPPPAAALLGGAPEGACGCAVGRRPRAVLEPEPLAICAGASSDVHMGIASSMGTACMGAGGCVAPGPLTPRESRAALEGAPIDTPSEACRCGRGDASAARRLSLARLRA
mmetsp:Transcript_10554/g.27366  ORF Transcript_10554/g.27366 Transcript_10554/m.27366 type:complete len:255 (-) Transcript_10554:169-933(-)